MKKVAFYTLGCKVNQYETNAMIEKFLDKNYEIVDFEDLADIYIINTCTVTNMSDRKSRQIIRRVKQINPKSILAVTGCYAQVASKDLEKIEEKGLIVGNTEKKEIVKIIEKYCEKNVGVDAHNDPKNKGNANFYNKINLTDINNQKEFVDFGTTVHMEKTRAVIKVQDGCDRFCSYCIIPYARGRVRSRSMDSVLDEVNRLAANGYKEVVLTGIHLSSYGVETGESLLHLIQEIHKIEGIKRIRLGSLEPKVVTEEFASELSKLEKICPHFHLSLQSGCDATLQRMNRKYTTEEYENGCNLLRKYFMHPAITTDVIVGFPGETEEEFAETKAFLERIHFYEMHIFKYSKRQGTRAAVMKDQIPEEVKTTRSNQLMEMEAKMSEEFRQYYLGKETEVLFEEETEIDGKSYYIGHTKEYVKVAKVSKEPLDNQLVSGTLKKAVNEEIYLMD